MQKRNIGTLARLVAVVGALVLGGMQQPASAAIPQSTCGGGPGCWACTAEDEEGNFCIVWYCNGQIDYWCW